MLKSLLVPLDGSGPGERGLPLAGQLSKATGASVHLVHVHLPYEPDQLLSNTSFQWEGLDLDEYDARHKEDESAYLTDVESRFTKLGVLAHAELLYGPPIVDELESYAAKAETDLVVMSSHGRSGVRRVWFGSVADEMIRRSNLPVIVIQRGRGADVSGDGPSVGHILVPLDGSRLGEQVLGPATDLAGATGARITLAHVLSAQTTFGLPISPRLRHGSELDRMRTYLEERAEAIAADGLDVDVHLAPGRTPAREITAMASLLEADLIAMATHGHGGVKRAVVGSVADRVIRECALPLLVMRPRLEA